MGRRSLFNSVATEMNSVEIRNYTGPVTLESLDAEYIALENKLERVLSAGKRLDEMSNTYTEVSTESLQSDMTYVRSIIMLNKDMLPEDTYSGLDSINISKEDRPSVVYSKIQLARENFIVDTIKSIIRAIVNVIKKIIDWIGELFKGNAANDSKIAKVTKPETLGNLDVNTKLNPKIAEDIAKIMDKSALPLDTKAIESVVFNKQDLIKIVKKHKEGQSLDECKALIGLLENGEISNSHRKDFLYLAACCAHGGDNSIQHELKVGQTIKKLKDQINNLLNEYLKTGDYEQANNTVKNSIGVLATDRVFPFENDMRIEDIERICLMARPIISRDEKNTVSMALIYTSLIDPIGHITYCDIKDGPSLARINAVAGIRENVKNCVIEIKRNSYLLHTQLQNIASEIDIAKKNMKEYKKIIEKFESDVVKNINNNHNNTYEINKILKYVRCILTQYCPMALMRARGFAKSIKTAYAYALACAAGKNDIAIERLVVSTEDASLPKVTHDNVTKFAISSPNIIQVTNIVVKDVEGLTNDDASIPLAVQAAPKVIEKVTKELEAIHTDPTEYIDTVDGKEWLKSEEGQRVIKAAVEEVKEERDMISFEIMPEVSKETSVAAKAYASDIREDASDEEQERDYEDTLEEASDNADKISRLENIEDIIASGYANVENAVSIESAVVYSKMMDLLRIELKDKLDITQEEYKVSKEEAAYDPRGALFVAQEGLTDFFIQLFLAIKDLIVRFIKFIKKLWGKSVIMSTWTSNKANKLIKTIANKKDITKEQFDTVEIRILNKYRLLAHVGDYTFKGMADYIQETYNSNLKKVADQPLKDSYSIVNKLKNDLNSNNADTDKDVEAIEKLLSEENIRDNVFKPNRANRISKLDNESNDGLPIYITGKTLRVLKINGKGFDIVKNSKIEVKGVFNYVPNNKEILDCLKLLSNAKNLVTNTNTQVEQIVNYCEKFIELFKGYKPKHNPTSPVTTVSRGLISYSKMVTTRVASLETASIVTNTKALLNMCSAYIDAADNK